MRTRYFLIEPKYADPETFASFIIGSSRMRASIDMYADMDMLFNVAEGLRAPELNSERDCCNCDGCDDDGWNGISFGLAISVLPQGDEVRILRLRIWQEWLDDGAPYRTEVRFVLTKSEAHEFANTLGAWCRNPGFTFSWIGN